MTRKFEGRVPKVDETVIQSRTEAKQKIADQEATKAPQESAEVDVNSLDTQQSIEAQTADVRLRETPAYQELFKAFRVSDVDNESSERFDEIIDNWVDLEGDDPESVEKRNAAKLLEQEMSNGSVQTDRYRENVDKQETQRQEAEAESLRAEFRKKSDAEIDATVQASRATHPYREARKQLSGILDSMEPGAARDTIFKQVDQLREVARQQGDAKTVEAYNQFLSDVDSEKIDIAAMSRRKSELYKAVARDTINQLALNPDSTTKLEEQLDAQWGDRKDDGNETARVTYAQALQDLRSGRLSRQAKIRLRKADAALGMDLQAISTYAREHLAANPESQPEAFHAAANIDLRRINELSAVADQLEDMGWLDRTFGSKGKAAKAAKAELEELTAQLEIVENEQATLQQELAPQADQPELFLDDLEEVHNVQELRGTWPADINTILTGLASGNTPPNEAMRALLDSEGFEEWAASLEGAVMDGVISLNENELKKPITVLGIQQGEKPTDTAIYFKLANGKQRARRLDEFMTRNFFTAEELESAPQPQEAEAEEAVPQRLTDLMGEWPSEINSVLGALATESIDTQAGFDKLEDLDSFMDWKSSLKGLELTGVIKGDGAVIDDTLTISSIRKNSGGKPTVYMKRPDGRRVTMSLERFLKQNLIAESGETSDEDLDEIAELHEATTFRDRLNAEQAAEMVEGVPGGAEAITLLGRDDLTVEMLEGIIDDFNKRAAGVNDDQIGAYTQKWIPIREGGKVFIRQFETGAVYLRSHSADHTDLPFEGDEIADAA